MFGLFGKKPSIKKSVIFCESLVQDAQIDVVLEGGKYKAFLVVIDTDGATLADHFKFPEARAVIVKGIEDRIANGQYDDPSDGIGMIGEMREMTNWKPNTNVLRAVVGRANKPLFSWNPANT